MVSMKCARYREAASARLDNEPLGMSASALTHHLASCGDCAAWLEDATRIGRGLRMSGQTPPDLSAGILAAVELPARRISAYRRLLRLALIALGIAQWTLALPALFGDQIGMAMSMHASHENAAWSLAVGAAFLAVAVRPSRAAGSLPVLGTFAVTLVIVSLPDLADGSVGAVRLASHGGVVLGVILVLLMERSQRLLPPIGRSEELAPEDAAGQAHQTLSQPMGQTMNPAMDQPLTKRRRGAA
jgi:predicted anti-sigma-YlaC factor YlaD